MVSLRIECFLWFLLEGGEKVKLQFLRSCVTFILGLRLIRIEGDGVGEQILKFKENTCELNEVNVCLANGLHCRYNLPSPPLPFFIAQIPMLIFRATPNWGETVLSAPNISPSSGAISSCPTTVNCRAGGRRTRSKNFLFFHQTGGGFVVCI